MRNILNWPLIGHIFKKPVLLNSLRMAVFLVFASAVYFGLVYPDKESNPYTNALFWSLFWPFFLIVTMATFGSLFCTICPHSFIGKYLNKIGPQKLMPNWLRNRWWGLGLLILSYWIPLYAFPGLLRVPEITALYFLILTVVAFIAFYLYRNMDYCRYLCPIGSVTKAFSKVSFVSLQTDQSECKTCRSFDCVKSCQWNLRPYMFEKKNNMQDCTLCMDCAHACDSVKWQITPLAKQLVQPAKQLEKMTAWVFFSLLVIITMTMRFHHSLGHSSIKDSLPWVQLGQWSQQTLGSIPMLDWVGVWAMLFAFGFTSLLVFGGYALTSKITGIDRKELFYKLGLSLGPVMLIGALSHIGSSFFRHYVPDVMNAFYWLLNLPQTAEPLASFRTPWLHWFGLFNYLGALIGAWVLYKALQKLNLSRKQFWLSFIASGAIIWGYLALTVLGAMVRSGH